MRHTLMTVSRHLHHTRVAGCSGDLFRGTRKGLPFLGKRLAVYNSRKILSEDRAPDRRESTIEFLSHLNKAEFYSNKYCH